METDTATYRTAHTGDPTAALHADSFVFPGTPGFFPNLRLLGLDAQARARHWIPGQEPTSLSPRGGGGWPRG